MYSDDDVLHTDSNLGSGARGSEITNIEIQPGDVRAAGDHVMTHVTRI